ncbi:MAG TPA: BTAD domain-containing putative transcriptional regulator [Streptosporangiaceae bacterium]|nr:BTAD domain-containing putative transcriptional regulator [Streptosporangiaceae bacterium]
MEFRILGPLEVADGSQRLELGGPRQQVVLAMLLLSPNNVVTLGRLQEAIYGEDLPPTSRSQAQISISSLRRLFTSHGHAATIATRAGGYVIGVGAGQLDSQRFRELVTTARHSSHLDQAVAAYRDALRLWRGSALDGIDSQLVRAAASRLDEERLATIEDRLTLELDLGRHHELVGELAELVDEFPLRERLRGQLMLALYRCDRTAEALQVYRQARRTMIDELGIEPGEPLQKLEHAILTTDPALDRPKTPVTLQPAGPQVPSLLPAGIADFTGRAGLIEQIGGQLIDRENRLAAPVVVITGQGGVGKTSLAVRVAHGVADHFPDGQLFADLHAGTAHPVGPMYVLERFLRVLGVPGPQVPPGLDERAEVYRNLLAGRKMLVVLDDAASESQVSPLLPGSEAAAVVITSRGRLAGLAGATCVEVDVLGAGQSVELLARIAGADRVQAQSQAATAVAGQCGHLPLALRIAGARLAARPHWSVQQLADRLADETRRLDELRHGELGIRASISLSYDGASEPARRLLRRLALLDAPVFSGWLSAALLDQPETTDQPDNTGAEDLLDDLVSARLVETVGSGSGVHSQYRLHDLIRVFARERLAAEETAADREAALERALGALLYLADEAHHRYYGRSHGSLTSNTTRWPLPGRLVEQLVSDPLAWYERERAALVSGVRQAARAGFTELCWSLALRATALFEARAYFDDWRETNGIALAATRQARNVRGQAAILYSMGLLYYGTLRVDSARQEFGTAARLFLDAGDDYGVALVTSQIAHLDRLSGRLDDAARGSREALAIFRRTGDQVATAYALQNLALIKLEQNDFGDARELLSEALALVQAARCERVEAMVLHRMGEAHLLAGDPARASDTFELALAKVRGLADPTGEAYALQGLGVAKVRQGESGPARSALQRAVVLAGTAGDRLIEARALLGLAELALASDDPRQAVVLGQQAAGAFRDVGVPLIEAQALILLSDAHLALGDSASAAAAKAQAAALRAGSARGATVA